MKYLFALIILLVIVYQAVNTKEVQESTKVETLSNTVDTIDTVDWRTNH